MADVWVLQGLSGPGGKLELDAVVLGNRKILTQHEGIKELLEQDFEVADSLSDEGKLPTAALFEFLNATHNSAYGKGRILSSEEARELVKKNGGI